MRKMEHLNRGLVAARLEKGMYLTWRFLGNEPDGIAWRVYRKRGDGDWERAADILPRDVPPESSFPENPGIVKKNTAPCCWVDPDGRPEDQYAVCPVTDGREGPRETLMLPVLEPLAGEEGQAFRAAVHRIPLAPPPERVPLAHFSYRGVTVGPGCEPDPAAFRLDNGEDWYRVDMDLLRAFREPYENREPLAPEKLEEIRSRLSELLGVFARCGANILTINQSLPSNGCAAVTISIETAGMNESAEMLIADLDRTPGVLKAEVLAG